MQTINPYTIIGEQDDELQALRDEIARLRADLAAANEIITQHRDHIRVIEKRLAAMTAENLALIAKMGEQAGALAAMTAERDAAQQYIRDMLYEATLLVDSAMCDFCDRWENGLCWAGDCKADCKMRGPEPKEGV